MRQRVAVFAFLVTLPLFLSFPLSGQTPTSNRALPRTPEGKPDLSGIWQVMNTADWNILPHEAHKGFPAGLGIVNADSLPYQPWAVAKQKENFAVRESLDTDGKCFLPGVPRIMYEPYPFQITQTPQTVIMLFEYVNAMRNVYLDTPHPPGKIDWWMGDSRGKWEGDTLVVDAAGFNDQSRLDVTGHRHSNDLRIQERFRRRDFGHLDLSVTVDDPKTFTRPFTIKVTELLIPDSDVLESVCNENEKDRTHLGRQ